MFSKIAMLVSLAALLQTGSTLAEAQKDSGKATGTSTQRLQIAPQDRPSDDEKERNRIRLGITQQQQQQIDDLWNETRARMDEVRKAHSEKQRLLWEEYSKYDIDDAKVKSLRIETYRLNRKMGDIQVENERTIRKILSREQFDKLRQLMKEQFERRRQERERRGGRPGGQPGPHFR